jgi:YHS domain-containing protein
MVRVLVYLFDLIFVIVVARLVGLVFQRLLGGRPVGSWSSRSARPSRAPDTREGQTARDPVCGMFVSTELSHRLTQGGQTLHFCSHECLERFQKDAAKA